jgi:hypothetical protein
MKLPMPLQCGCGEKFTLEIVGSEPPEYAQCPKCHSSGYVFKPLGNLVTRLLMERAKQELVGGDVTIAILLSAIAVEGEMAYLFFKWKGIDSGKVLANQTADDKEQWEKEWTGMRSVGKRLDELSRLLTGKPFDEFARPNKKLLEPALTGYNPASRLRISCRSSSSMSETTSPTTARSTFKRGMASSRSRSQMLCLPCCTQWT